MRRSSLLFFGVAALVGLGPSPGHARQPNIILILADDFGYECVGANGGESYETPNLDDLAATGMRFDECHVQPLCTPTRVQLMTGLYNIRNYASFGAIDRDAMTFAHHLKKAGYVTAIAGKWQLGRGNKLPERLGFEEACLWQHTRRPPRYANPGLEFNGQEKDFTNGEYGPDLINDFAIDFITRHKDRPFFLYYPMLLTHSPFQPTPDNSEWDPKARGERSGKDVKHFADMVAYMDKLVGRVVAKVDELGLRENTVIIFLGDNGTGRDIVSRFRGQPYPGGKGLTNARGTHVPLIANWQGRIPAGRVNGDLIASTDFLPTLCDLAGAKLPASTPADGQSFLPQLLGQQGEPRAWIYFWYARNGGPTATHEFAMTAKRKLYRDGRFFDLTTDPFEEHPLPVDTLSGDAEKAARTLRLALDQYVDARPAHLREPASRAAKGDPARKAAKKQRRARKRSAD